MAVTGPKQAAIFAACTFFSLLFSQFSIAASKTAEPIPIKVVVVSMFEHGDVVGDEPGEFQFWIERFPLPTKHDFPAGPYPLYSNDRGVLGICLGGGIANATASIMALGLDGRFDLSNAYFLIAGIAGGDPQDTTLGSAVWANHIVDGDLLYEIDAREIPENWPYGLIPLGGSEPADEPEDLSTGWSLDTIHFPLDERLTTWAYELTRSMTLKDTPEMASFRARYKNHPNAQKPPVVSMGATLSASTYWHGERMNRWANDWTKLYAGSNANFVTSNMEDSGTLTALTRLGRLGKVKPERTLVLRTVSNFTTPPAQQLASSSATQPYANGGRPSLIAAFEVGRTVVEALLADKYDKYIEVKNDTSNSTADN